MDSVSKPDRRLFFENDISVSMPGLWTRVRNVIDNKVKTLRQSRHSTPPSPRPARMLHQADPKGAGERPASGRPRELQARLLHACLLSAAALSGVDAQFASPDAHCSFASFATRLQAREAFTIPSLAAA